MTNTLRIGILIHRNGRLLGPDLLERADKALAAHDARNFTEAVAQAAQCLERLLKNLLQAWAAPVTGLPALGPLIGAVDKTGKAPELIIERFNQANRIRNIVLHDKPLAKISTATEGDSLLMLQILAIGIEWFVGTVQPGESQEIPGELPVFFSVGTAHRLDQEQFLARLRSEMRGLGVELRTVESSDFTPDKPFDQIRDLMRTCCAALVLGLERSHAYAIFERERSEREKLHHDQYIPTAWNQIEGAIASALQLPILVLRERRLYREGIFEAENHRHRIRDFDLASECKGLSHDLRDFLAGWVEHVRVARQATRS